MLFDANGAPTASDASSGDGACGIALDVAADEYVPAPAVPAVQLVRFETLTAERLAIADEYRNGARSGTDAASRGIVSRFRQLPAASLLTVCVIRGDFGPPRSVPTAPPGVAPSSARGDYDALRLIVTPTQQVEFDTVGWLDDGYTMLLPSDIDPKVYNDWARAG
jgi:hypothetical protein